MSCDLCHDAGWVLDTRLDKAPPRMIEVIPCPVPDCVASGVEVQSICFKGPEFQNVYRRRNGVVMAVGQ